MPKTNRSGVAGCFVGDALLNMTGIFLSFDVGVVSRSKQQNQNIDVQDAYFTTTKVHNPETSIE